MGLIGSGTVRIPEIIISVLGFLIPTVKKIVQIILNLGVATPRYLLKITLIYTCVDLLTCMDNHGVHPG